MSYLATRPDSQVYFQPAIDYFSGNGATSQFTLSRPVASVAQIIVSVANVIQNPNTFSVNNNILTLGGNAPVGTNNVWVQYQTAVIQVNQPGQGTVGAAQLQAGAALANIGAGGLGQSYLAAGVAGTGPAFRAVTNSATNLSASTSTKIIFGNEVNDSSSCYDPTLSRFTPNVPGYYVLGGFGTIGSTAWGTNGAASARVLINGGSDGIYNDLMMPNNSNWHHVRAEGLFYMNGTTDYAEFYIWAGPAVVVVQYGGYGNFYGYMVRSA